jgi:hypothetical protein
LFSPSLYTLLSFAPHQVLEQGRVLDVYVRSVLQPWSESTLQWIPLTLSHQLSIDNATAYLDSYNSPYI